MKIYTAYEKRFMMYQHPYAGLIKVEIIAQGKGWAMVRRKKAIPFCVMTKELKEVEVSNG